MVQQMPVAVDDGIGEGYFICGRTDKAKCRKTTFGGQVGLVSHLTVLLRQSVLSDPDFTAPAEDKSRCDRRIPNDKPGSCVSPCQSGDRP